MPHVTLDPADHIYISTWEDLAVELGPPVHFRTTEFCPQEWENYPKCVLVSACSDFSVQLQNLYHPNLDLVKHANFFPWSQVEQARDGYRGVRIPPPVTEHCNPAHKYILKVDRFSHSTFSEIPPQVKSWYITNLNVRHPRMRWIPFGLNTDGVGYGMVKDFVNRPKKGLLYVNCQDYTLDRIYLKRLYSKQPWVTYRPTPNLPVATFLDELSSHHFALCPFGNGLDCYRVLECLYTGVVPVMQESAFANYYLNAALPVLVVPDLAALTAEFLTGQIGRYGGVYDYSRISRSYWKKHLEAERDQL